MIFLTASLPGLRAFADAVERRGGAARLVGDVVRVNEAGVTLRSATGTEHFIPWDRVRSVAMERPDPLLERYRATADALWRARTRLERGDAALAEPLFERLFAEYRGQNHETALVVAEGLLRCRLARGANDLAVIPALEAARLRRKGQATDSYANLPPALDEQTSLCMGLPPVWVVSGTALVEVEQALKDYEAQGDTTVSALAKLYRRAVRQHLGMPPLEDESVLAADHAGVALLRALIELGSADAALRETARAQIAQQLHELRPWAQAWVHYLVGESLLRETGVGRRQVGQVSLARLPATFAGSQPYLAGLVLARLADELERGGDADAATALRNELRRLYPNHPVLARPLARLGILDFGFWTLNSHPARCALAAPRVRNDPQSKIQNPKSRIQHFLSTST